MARTFLQTALLLLLLSIFGAASAAARVTTECIKPGDSALSQYCETVPAAGGGQMASGSVPTLATALPQTVTRALRTGPTARRALLGLPAAHVQHIRATPARRSSSVVRAGASGLPGWLIALLAAFALVLVMSAVGRRYSRGNEPPDQLSG